MIETIVATYQLIPPAALIGLFVLAIIMAAFALVLVLPEDELSITPDQITRGHRGEDR